MNWTLLVTLGRMSRIWECGVCFPLCVFLLSLFSAADLNPHEKGGKNLGETKKKMRNARMKNQGGIRKKYPYFAKKHYTFMHVGKVGTLSHFKINRRKSVKSVSSSERVGLFSLSSLFPGWSFSLRHKNASSTEAEE